MPSFALRLLPALVFLGFLASPYLPDLQGWGERGDLTTAVGTNGMTIDPDGGGAPVAGNVGALVGWRDGA